MAQPIAALFGFAKQHFAFFRGFFAQGFLAIIEGCPHISRLGRVGNRKRGCGFGSRMLLNDQNGSIFETMTAQENQMPARKISVFGREFKMPRSRGLRIAIGFLLTIGGILGFLPILGFWMVPLGLLVLSYEFALVRRHRRRFVVWWERRRRPD